MKRFLLLLLALSPLASATTYTVTTASDPAIASGSSVTAATGVIVGAGTTVSLRSAIIAANMSGAGPHTINVPAGLGTYNLSTTNPSTPGTTSTNGLNDLQIGSNGSTITVQGTGGTAKIVQTVSGNDVITTGLVDSSFTPAIVNLTLDHLEISGGTFTGIFTGADDAANHRSSTTITNCNIHDNSNADSQFGQGGAIQNATGSLTISNTTFTNNSATNSSKGQGGAIYYSIPNAAGAQGVVGSLSITGCTFTNNHSGLASGVGGGAIYVNVTSASGANGANTQITGCTFSGNTCTGSADGGALAVDGNRATDIFRNTFTTNGVSGTGHGGAIAVNNGATNINFNRIKGNTATTATNGTAIYNAGSSTVNANINWWGSNSGAPSNAIVGTVLQGNNLVYSFTASPTSVPVGGTVAMTASFLLTSAASTVSPANLTALIGLPITFDNPVDGTLSAADTTLQSTGTAAVTFTGTTVGAGSARANFDGAQVTGNVTVTAPDLTVAMSHTGNFIQGQTGKTYTVTPTNSGNAVTSGTVNVAITLPTGLTATGLSGAGWTIDSNTTAHRTDALAIGTSYPLTLTVSVAADATSPLVPSVTVSGGGEVVTNNDSASDSTIILSTDATLTSLATNAGAGALSPTFDSATGTYNLDLPSGTTGVTVTPTVHQANATVKVNTVAVASGTASGNISTPLSSATTITVVVTAQDTVTKTYTLTVRHAPAFTSTNSATITVGTSSPFTITTSGFPRASDAMVLSKTGTLPAGVSFTDNGDGSATLGGVPAALQGGAYTLGFGANNGIGTAASQSFTLTVNETPAIISAASATFTEGVFSTFTVTASGYPKTGMTISRTGATLPTGVSFVSNGDGTATLSGTPAVGQAGPYNFTLTPGNGIGSPAGQSFALTVKSAVDHFVVSAPSTATAGTPVSVTVTAKDNANATAAGYTGTVHFTSTDAQAGLPANYTFVAGDNGVHTFTTAVTLKTAGTQTVSVADIVTTSATGTSGSVTVGADTAAAFAVSAPGSAIAGNTVTFTATAKDAYGNTATSYTGTARFTSSDAAAILPADYTFLAGDNGVHTFTGGATLKTSGSKTLTATDTVTATITGTSANIAVSPGAATHFTVSAPSTSTAGGPISAVVTALDAFNNTATGYTGTVHFTSTDTSASTGLPPDYTFAPADHGVHTFAASTSLTTAGAQTLTVTDTGNGTITGTSGTITVSPRSATHFTVSAPGSATSGTPFNFTATAQDQFGNTDTAYSGTIHFTSTDGAAILPANATLTNGAGTFSATLKTAGSKTLTATDTASSITGTSAGITVGAGAATQLAVSQGPTNTVAGTSISPAVTVQIKDAAGNLTASTAAVTLQIGANPGGGTLSGTVTAVAVNGVATFPDLSIDKTGTGYTLAASSGSLSSATSGTFNVTPGAASKLVFSVQPSNAVAGTGIAPSTAVQVQDTFGNLTTSTSSVTLGLDTNPGSGTLSGTTTVAAVNGVATFPGVSIDKTGTGYKLSATSAGLSSATSSAFNITPAAASKVVFITQPSTAVAGVAISPAITAQIQDSLGNLTTSTASVTLGFGSNAGSGTLSGTSTVNAVNGVATFTGISIDKTATGYTLAATSPGLTSATSNPFNITPAAANKLVFVAQPSNAVAGASIAPAITVQIQDSFGNLTSSTASVALAFGNNAGSGTLTGGAAVAAVNGVATFSGVSIDKTGTGYTLAASSSGLTGATSGTFNITPGSASKLAYSVQPSTAVAGVAITPAIVVQIQDSFGNQTTSTASVALSIGNNPGSGTLTGGAAVAAVNGVATFSGASINKTGTSYTLTASSPGLSGATSTPFNITPAAASKVVFATQPSNAVAGVGISPAITAQIQDSLGNLTASTASVTLAFGTNAGSGTLSGTTTVNAVSGVATFSGISVNKAATGYTLAASSSGLTGATSGTFDITPAAANKLVFVTQPSNAVAGASITPAITVQIQDSFGNLTSSTSSVNLGIGTNPGTSTIAGTTNQTAVAGTATFSGISLNKVGTNYTLSASSSGLTGATSGTFNITPGAATHLAVTAPGSATAGTAFNFTVTAQDAFNNTATGYAGTVGYTASDAAGVLPANGTLTNGTATLSATLKTGGSQTITATDTITPAITGTSGAIVVAARSDLAVSMSGGTGTLIAGTNVTYTINVVNNGPSAATTVSLTDVIPTGTTFVSLSSVSGWSATTPAAGAAGSVVISKNSVAPAETASFTLVIRIPSSGNNLNVTNTATITTATPEISTTDNSASNIGMASASSDIAISGVLSAPPVAGSNVTYTVTATNNGPSDSSNLEVSSSSLGISKFVSATTPQGWTLSAPAVGTSGAIRFSGGSLASGASVEFKVVALIPSDTAATTQLSVFFGYVGGIGPDPMPNNNSYQFTGVVTRSADLSITVVDSPDPVNVSQNLTYTVNVTNNGPSDSASVSVSDVLPAHVTFVSTTAPSGWSPSTPAVGGTGTVTFSKTAVANAETASFTIVVKVDTLTPNNTVISNTATVSASVNDPNTSNNSASCTTTVKAGADLAISGSASTPAVAGADVTYTFTAVNNGPLDADSAVVTDVLPAGTTFVSATPPAGWTVSAPAAGTNGSVIFSKTTAFANAASADFTVVAHIASNVAASTVLHNGIAASSATLDVFPLNSSASLDSTVTTKSDLAITNSAAPNPTAVGGNVTYSITVINNGPSDATGPGVSTPLPSSVTFVSATAPGGWTKNAPSVGSGGTVTFSNTVLANGASASFTIVAKVKTGTANGATVNAVSTVSSTGNDPVSNNNDATGTFKVGTVNPTPVQVTTTGTLNKQTGLYELPVTVTNTTPNPINGFRLHVDFTAYKAAYPSLRLYNSSSGPSSPDVYVDYPYPLPIDGATTVKLLFYTSTRTFPSPFSPLLTVETLATSQTGDANNIGVQATFRILPDGTHLLEFPSVIGRWYRVRYSSDMQTWYDSPVPIQASGTKTQFIDSGAPYTNISPADPSVHSRFYIVVQIPTP